MKAGFFLFLQLNEETDISVTPPCVVLQPDTKFHLGNTYFSFLEVDMKECETKIAVTLQ